MNTKFAWGYVLDYMTFDFDGVILKVTKYHPNLTTVECQKLGVQNAYYTTKIQYHVEEMRESFDNMFALLLAWIAYKQLGANQYALVSGLCRALEIK